MTRIFLTGGSGYIGGQVLHTLQSTHPEYECIALLRDSEKAATVSKTYPRVRIILGDLDSTSLIEEEARQADVVINAATYKHQPSIEAIARGLASRSTPGHWIQISGASILSIPDIVNKRFGEASGKLYDDVNDASEIRDIIKHNANTRVADNYLVNLAGPKTALIFPPIIYGQGEGPVNQRSIQIPELSRVAIQTRQTVQVGKGESTWSNIHISDLANVFVGLVEKAVEGDDNSLWNHDGLYFVGNADVLSFGEISQLVAETAHGLGLTDSASVKSVGGSDADELTAKGSVFWGTNARQHSQRAARFLGWSQKAHSLKEEIPTTVKVIPAIIQKWQGPHERVPADLTFWADVLPAGVDTSNAIKDGPCVALVGISVLHVRDSLISFFGCMGIIMRRWQKMDPGRLVGISTRKDRLSMTAHLKSNLLSGSIDLSLAEIELRSRDCDYATDDNVVIGPFGVLNFASNTETQDQPPSEFLSQIETQPLVEPSVLQEDGAFTVDPGPVMASADAVVTEGIQDTSPHSIIDSLSGMNDFLHWSDLLSFDIDPSGLAKYPTLSMQPDMSIDLDNETGLMPLTSSTNNGSMTHLLSDQTSIDLVSAVPDLLHNAQFLLKHFQDVVIPHIMAIPFGLKSPWKMLNLPAAVVTFGDSTFLGTDGVSHARLANLFGIIACSALDLALRPHDGILESSDHWHYTATQLYQNAKDHMQISLQHETQGPRKAKYKDQLMSANILTQYAILSGQQQHARCFLIDAEQLLRLRGLSKTRISKKARLLHHVYTWLRILGESTFVLHDYGLSYSCLDNLGSSSQTHAPRAIGDASPVQSEPNPRLDDFLRLGNQNSDNDLNIDEPKDRASGYNDIHLHDSRSFSEQLYKQIYGIPETWLSLISQTTRLANVMETFRVARSSGKAVSMEVWEKLQRRSMRLENMICSLNLGRNRAHSTDLQSLSKPHACMLEALNQALMIFFYRRIRNVHPAVLQGHVDNVINALEECNDTLSKDVQAGPGTAWPIFIAGSEALTNTRREGILRWLDNASSKCGCTSFATARDVMMKVWRMQDEHLIENRGDPMLSWTDVVKKEQIWPLFF
ncbi:hypothetical protein N7466_001806 [Penicillium verhagenii]|uniref:uncharacterized protein n=1 Tax=Penicillium verhagenii TaxID=1562060 RepID=UPI002545A61B|nr:uncharacterized protein N7466_001806 [Penicillium verhagenii]KAJ5938672.1 hypothetical protein N7466_001806 [Penicillium verhagenii]